MVGMRIVVVLVALAIAPAAHADTDTFISPGISIGYGTRGWVVGTEVSLVNGNGYYMTGVVAGFEVAINAEASQPWGRVYLEGEFSLLIAGLGGGPALMLGDTNEVHFQLTPYVGVWGARDINHCILPLAIPYYRFTTQREGGIHEFGMFAKVVTRPQGCEGF